jgi:hypothetical protein
MTPSTTRHCSRPLTRPDNTYPDESTKVWAVLSDFHRMLEAADHYRSVARSAGKEWFVTSTRFLDELARVMRLPVIVGNEDSVDDA